MAEVQFYKITTDVDHAQGFDHIRETVTMAIEHEHVTYIAWAQLTRNHVGGDNWQVTAYDPYPANGSTPLSIWQALGKEAEDVLRSIASNGPEFMVRLNVVRSNSSSAAVRARYRELWRRMTVELKPLSSRVASSDDELPEILIPDDEHRIIVKNSNGSYWTEVKLNHEGISVDLWRNLPGKDPELVGETGELWSDILE